jgi:membrane-associated protein
MTDIDWLLALVPQYGLWLLVATTFLSCLALPIPASILMLTAGGFVAMGELEFWPALLAACLGGILGDQFGFWAGHKWGAPLLAHAAQDRRHRALLVRAKSMLTANGVMTIFLTRWLFSPLGPWVNLMTGAARYSPMRFALASIAGEAVWAGIYIGFGFAFAGNIAAANDLLGSVLGLIAALSGVVVLGLWLRHARKSV